MTDTPRTDAASRHREGLGLESGKVCSDFARELERELVAAKAENADLKARIDTAWGDNAANDRITDRLRADLVAAQGYRSAAEEIARRAREMVDARTAEVAKANAERDEARRDLCVSEAIDRLQEANPNALISYSESRRIAREIAAERGWDCFEKEAKP